jgi:hypothetical protein
MWWDLMSYPYKIQVVQMLTAANKQCRQEFCQDFLQFVQQYHTTSDCLWFGAEAHLHLNGFTNKQNMMFSTSENPHRLVETLFHPAKCTVW